MTMKYDLDHVVPGNLRDNSDWWEHRITGIMGFDRDFHEVPTNIVNLNTYRNQKKEEYQE